MCKRASACMHAHPLTGQTHLCIAVDKDMQGFIEASQTLQLQASEEKNAVMGPACAVGESRGTDAVAIPYWRGGGDGKTEGEGRGGREPGQGLVWCVWVCMYVCVGTHVRTYVCSCVYVSVYVHPGEQTGKKGLEEREGLGDCRGNKAMRADQCCGDVRPTYADDCSP